MLRTILAVQISNSCPNVKSKPFIDYMPQDYPAFATCSRPEVSLGGLDAAADLGEIFVEHDQVLTDLKIKAEASDVAMKVQTNETERLKKQVETTETLLRQLLSPRLR
jgi:predicted  nucleic acid-binding Zn-ribbon protein